MGGAPRRLAGLVAASAVVLAGTGCLGPDEPQTSGSAATGTGASADAGRRLSTEEAELALPIVSQLPSGLTVAEEDPAASDPQQSSYPSQCMDLKLDGQQRRELDESEVARAERGYQVSGGGYLSATVTSYSGEVPAQLFDDADEATGSCATFTLNDKDGPSSWEMSPLAVDDLGDRTLALDLRNTKDETADDTKEDGPSFEGGVLELLAVADGHNLVVVIYSVVDPSKRVDLLSDKVLRATVDNLGDP